MPKKLKKICVCCNTNFVKSKAAKYCKSCSDYLFEKLSQKTRIGSVGRYMRQLVELIEDLKK